MGRLWITIEADTLEDAEDAAALLNELDLEEKTRTVVQSEGATQIVLGTETEVG